MYNTLLCYYYWFYHIFNIIDIIDIKYFSVCIYNDNRYVKQVSALVNH